jgi:hypothetical protein
MQRGERGHIKNSFVGSISGHFEDFKDNCRVFLTRVFEFDKSELLPVSG